MCDNYTHAWPFHNRQSFRYWPAPENDHLITGQDEKTKKPQPFQHRYHPSNVERHLVETDEDYELSLEMNLHLPAPWQLDYFCPSINIHQTCTGHIRVGNCESKMPEWKSPSVVGFRLHAN